MDEKKLGRIVALAEKARGRHASEITTEEMVSIAKELDIPQKDALAAAAHINALEGRDAVTISSTDDVLFLMSRRVGLRWPIVVRIFGSAAIGILAVGWSLRMLPTSRLMAIAALPFVAIAAWYSYRCVALATEKVTLALSEFCELRIHSLPFAGRTVRSPLEQLDLLPPEMATDEDGGFEIAPMYWLPLRIGGKTVHVCAGHKKADLVMAYERISNWLNTKRSDNKSNRGNKGQTSAGSGSVSSDEESTT
jgi:hypothetical protein